MNLPGANRLTIGQGVPGGAAALPGSLPLPGGGTLGPAPALPQIQRSAQPNIPLISPSRAVSPNLIQTNTAQGAAQVGSGLRDILGQQNRIGNAGSTRSILEAINVLDRVRHGNLSPTKAAKMMQGLTRGDQAKLADIVAQRSSEEGHVNMNELKALQALQKLPAPTDVQPHDILTNAVGDASNLITGLPAGLALTGVYGVKDFIAASKAAMKNERPKKSELYNKILKPVGQQYAKTYGPALHGDIGGTLDQFQQHPLQPVLDAAALASVGVSTAGRVAAAGRAAEAGRVSEAFLPAVAKKAAKAPKIPTEPPTLGSPKFPSGISVDYNDAIHSIHAEVNHLLPNNPEQAGPAIDALTQHYHQVYGPATQSLAEDMAKAGLHGKVHIRAKVSYDGPTRQLTEPEKAQALWEVTVGEGPEGPLTFTVGTDPRFAAGGKGRWVDDILPISKDENFFANKAQQDDYYTAVNAARGLNESGQTITLYRAMTPDEHAAWKRGEEIPEGKYFAREKEKASGQDIMGVFPKTYKFQVNADDVVETFDGDYQLRKAAKLEGNTVKGIQEAPKLPPKPTLKPDAVDELGVPLRHWTAHNLENNSDFTLADGMQAISAAMDKRTGKIYTSMRAHTEIIDDLAQQFQNREITPQNFDQYTVIVDRDGKVLSVNGKDPVTFGDTGPELKKSHIVYKRIKMAVEGKFAAGKALHEGSEPPIPPDHVRLYAGGTKVDHTVNEGKFTSDKYDLAHPDKAFYVDVPRADVDKYRADHGLYDPPPEIVKTAQPLKAEAEAAPAPAADNAMLEAAAMQVSQGGMSVEDAAKMFKVDPEELRAHMAPERFTSEGVQGGAHAAEQARILSNADVGAGEAATRHVTTVGGKEGKGGYTIHEGPSKTLPAKVNPDAEHPLTGVPLRFYEKPTPEDMASDPWKTFSSGFYNTKTKQNFVGHLGSAHDDILEAMTKKMSPGKLPSRELSTMFEDMYEGKGNWVPYKVIRDHQTGDVLKINAVVKDEHGNWVRAPGATADLEAAIQKGVDRVFRPAEDLQPRTPLPTFTLKDPKGKIVGRFTSRQRAVAQAQSLISPLGTSPSRAFLRAGNRGGLIDLYDRKRGITHEAEISATMKQLEEVFGNDDLRLDRRSFREVVSDMAQDIRATAAKDKNRPALMEDQLPSFISSKSTGRALTAAEVALREASDIVRAGAIYLRPAYLPNNWAGNVFMNLVHQGFVAPINLGKSFVVQKYMDPRNLAAMRTAMGTTAAEAVTAGTGRGYAASLTQPAAHIMGRIADQPFRDAAFLHEARRAGYRTFDQVNQLFNEASAGDPKALRSIATMARAGQEEIVKFGHMNDQERALIRNIVFVYSWMRGASRYAARLPLQHPLQAQVFNQLAGPGNKYVQSIMGGTPTFLAGSVPVGRDKNGNPRLINPFSLNPLGTGLQVLKAAGGTLQVLKNPKEFNKYAQNDVVSLLNPIIAAYIEARSGGQTVKTQLERTIAATALVKGWRHPGTGGIYPTTRGEAVGHFTFGALFPRVADKAGIQRALERENINNPAAMIPEQMKDFKKATGREVPFNFVSAYRADLEALQITKDFQQKYAESKGASGFRNMPPQNRLEAGIAFLRKYSHFPSGEINQLEDGAKKLTTDAQYNELANGVWRMMGIGQYRTAWQDMMNRVDELKLSRKR